MTGSVIDGEDVVQEALLKAIEALPHAEPLANPGGWLFRITYNVALDFLRRRARQLSTHSEEDPDTMVHPVNAVQDRKAVAASLRTFMRLPVSQRSTVILADVLGYSLDEVSEVIGGTLAATKSALQRGRGRLRELSQEPDERLPPTLAESERLRLTEYVDRFNARDFDAIRDMLASDVQLDLVNRLQAKGAEARAYFHRYDQGHDWRFVAGFVERRPAILVHDPDDPAARPSYFILLGWAGDRVATIRDFRFARYAMRDAELSPLEG
ncbi:MAG: sigma-70 family RNA polymerase sigma factor [Burkholderiaceae bacterium]